MASADPQPIVFVGFEGLEVLDVTGPWEVFNTAGLIAGSPPELRLLTPDGGDVRCSSGLSLRADGRDRRAPRPDRDAGRPGGLGVRAALRDPELVAAVASARAAGASGSPASAPGRSCLPRPACSTAAARRRIGRAASGSPSGTRTCDVEADPIFVRDGDVFTSAGVTAGMDLALALVEEDLGCRGRAADRADARRLCAPARRAGAVLGPARPPARGARADPRAPGLDRRAPRRGSLRRRRSPAASISPSGSSRGSSAASSGRRRPTTSSSSASSGPAASSRRTRRRSRTSPRRCGFAGAEVMRRAFQRRLGTSPSEYRQRFRPPLAA